MGRTVSPDELTKCEVCGEYKGIVKNYPAMFEDIDIKINCLCEGSFCENCHKVKVPAQGSNYYDAKTHEVWHVPGAFKVPLICRRCKPIVKERERQEDKMLREETIKEVSAYAEKMFAKLIGIWNLDSMDIFIFEPMHFVMEKDRKISRAYASFTETAWKFGNFTAYVFIDLKQIFLNDPPPDEEILSIEDWIETDED